MDQEKSLKNKIVKCAESVKKKVKLIRDSKLSADMTLESVLKPITEPLNKLVNKNSDKDNILFTPKAQSSPYKRSNLSTSKVKTVKRFRTLHKEESSSYASDTDDEKDNNEYREIVDKTADIITDGSLANTSNSHGDSEFATPEINSNDSWSISSGITDIPCGVRQQRGKLLMGNTRVSVSDHSIMIGSRTYTKTPGIVELLFKKNPDLNVITEDDKSNYREMLINTNAHRRDFDPKKPIKSNKGRKYTNIIRPMFIRLVKNNPTSSEVSGAGMLPVMKKINKNVDFVYWDDPNELVDRLKLLIASYDAGNNGVHNEIISIIEELRESKIIS